MGKFEARKAQKRQLAVKVLCAGSSGSGKTLTALRLAKGIVSKEGGQIFMINTEGDRGEMYGKGSKWNMDYEIIDLPDPRSPENYIEAIQYCIDQGASVIIIDSLSHEWNYLNEVVNNMPGNSFNNWGKVKPRHRKLVDFIVEAKTHIIATGRGKDEYVMEVNDKGKQAPKKVGIGIQQEKDTEYEYMVTFNIMQDTNVATVMKDNTGIFEGRYEVLTEKDGEALYNWANSGDAPVETKKVNTADLSVLREEIIGLAKELGGSKNNDVKNICETTIGTLNPNKSDDVVKLTTLRDELKVLKGGQK